MRRRSIGKTAYRYGVSTLRWSSSLVASGCVSGHLAGLQEILDTLSVEGHERDTAYATFLRKCAESGAAADVRVIHEHAILSGYDQGTFLGNILVQTYGKCGDMEGVREAFKNIWQKNVYSWNIAIAAFAQNGHLDSALDLFHEMEGARPTRVTFLAALGACCGLGDLEETRRIHNKVMGSGLECDTRVCNALVNTYGKCGSVEEARAVFDSMAYRDTISWTSMIAAYAQDGYGSEALELFKKMDTKPTEVTFVSALDACSLVGDLQEGRRIHAGILASGFQSQVLAGKSIGNALVNMYGRCGSLKDAKLVFDRMLSRDVVAWNALLAAYSRHGYAHEAMRTLQLMDLDGERPNYITFTSAVSACSSKEMLSEGRMLHDRVMRSSKEPDMILQNSFITMYSKCGSLGSARGVFNLMPRWNTQSWNAIIGACVQHGEMGEALLLFRGMQSRPDEVTFVSVLGACSSSEMYTDGTGIHELIVAQELEQDPVVGSALVNMYVKCGSLEDAKNVFDRLSSKTVVSWTAMVEGYVQSGRGKEALKLFLQMENEGWKPNEITYISLLGASAATGALSQGKSLHARLVSSGFETDVTRVGLINLYGKCGKIDEAKRVFDRLSSRNVIAWNAMMSAYAQQGYGAEALALFYDMGHQGVNANEITFMSVLFACSHEGKVEDSWEFFRSMGSDYGLRPRAEHHGTMVDLLARHGQLQNAEELIGNMPYEADVVSWTSLLGACKVHKDTDRGARVAARLVELNKDEEQSGAPYSLLTNIFAEAGRFDEAHRTCKLMELRGARRQTARSFIEVNGQVHEFVVGDSSHPKNELIRRKLDILYQRMKEEGYLPDTNVVLHNVDKDEKERMLMYHSERLAIGMGLIGLPQDSEVRVVKNIRVCSDCHGAIKLISKIVHRKIVLRDANRFHHFEDGQCSCKDFW